MPLPSYLRPLALGRSSRFAVGHWSGGTSLHRDGHVVGGHLAVGICDLVDDVVRSDVALFRVVEDYLGRHLDAFAARDLVGRQHALADHQGARLGRLDDLDRWGRCRRAVLVRRGVVGQPDRGSDGCLGGRVAGRLGEHGRCHGHGNGERKQRDAEAHCRHGHLPTRSQDLEPATELVRR